MKKSIYSDHGQHVFVKIAHTHYNISHFCKSYICFFVFSVKESGKGGDHEEKNKPSDKPETNTTEKIGDKPSPEKEEGKFLVTLLIN